MALFKKPKKNIRKRNTENDDEDLGDNENGFNNGEENEAPSVSLKASKKKEKEKTAHRSKQTTLLSFGDEEGNVYIKKFLKIIVYDRCNYFYVFQRMKKFFKLKSRHKVKN